MATQKPKSASKPQRNKNKPVARSGNPQRVAAAKELEQRKVSKKKKPVAVGGGFRKFSQIIVVVAVLAGLILSGLGAVFSMPSSNTVEPTENSNTLLDVDGIPLNGEVVEEPEWSNVEGLEISPEGGEVIEIPAEPAK